MKRWLERIPASSLKQYSFGEEIANGITHGIGVLFAIVGLTVLLLLSVFFGSGMHILSYLIYGISLLLLYTSSTLYHALPSLNAKRFFKICDHASIYLLIAGTYTPFFLVNLQDSIGKECAILIWSLALIGVIFKFFFAGRFQILSTILYLAMGWLAVLVLKSLSLVLSQQGLTWLIVGGMIYTIGSVFYLLKRVPFFHSIWHLFVLLGSVSHYAAIIYSANFSMY